MSRTARLIAIALAVVGLALIAGCGSAPKIIATVPENIGQIETTVPGSIYKELGYSPASMLFKADTNEHRGYIFVRCSDTRVPECGNNTHNMASEERPNLYTDLQGHIMLLEGPTRSMADGANYWVEVPAEYRDFAALNQEQRDTLIGIMPEVITQLERLAPNTRYTISTKIGLVPAWMGR